MIQFSYLFMSLVFCLTMGINMLLDLGSVNGTGLEGLLFLFFAMLNLFLAGSCLYSLIEVVIEKLKK